MATIKSDTKIMNLLKVTEIRHYVAQTNKGDLTLMLRKGDNEYRLVLDAVPLEDELSKELLALLFPLAQILPKVDKKGK